MSIGRIVLGLTHELREHPVAVVGVTPGWLRSEKMLDGFGVREDNWRDALARVPGVAISESPTYVGRGVAALAGDFDAIRWAGRPLLPRARERPRGDRHGRVTTGLLGYIAEHGIDEQSGQGVDEYR